jgi:ribosomal protein S18 acetylase RimI-like enzyme
MKIRAATPVDAAQIARVHVDSWRSTYRDLLPGDYLASLSYEERAKRWTQVLELEAERNFAFVVENDPGDIVGFVDSGPEREGRLGYDGELYAIYLLEEYHGRGWGRQLFERARADLAERGYVAMMLWVLKDNRTRGFYERMGGVMIGEKQAEIGGTKVIEVAYGWEKI